MGQKPDRPRVDIQRIEERLAQFCRLLLFFQQPVQFFKLSLFFFGRYGQQAGMPVIEFRIIVKFYFFFYYQFSKGDLEINLWTFSCKGTGMGAKTSNIAMGICLILGHFVFFVDFFVEMFKLLKLLWLKIIVEEINIVGSLIALLDCLQVTDSSRHFREERDSETYLQVCLMGHRLLLIEHRNPLNLEMTSRHNPKKRLTNLPLIPQNLPLVPKPNPNRKNRPLSLPSPYQNNPSAPITNRIEIFTQGQTFNKFRETQPYVDGDYRVVVADWDAAVEDLSAAEAAGVLQDL